MPHGSCFNWYFPDDDDDEEEGSHGCGLQSQRAALSTPELSVNRNGGSTAPLTPPSTLTCGSPQQNWLSGPCFYRFVSVTCYTPIGTLTIDQPDLWPFALTPYPPLTFVRRWKLQIEKEDTSKACTELETCSWAQDSYSWTLVWFYMYIHATGHFMSSTCSNAF